MENLGIGIIKSNSQEKIQNKLTENAVPPFDYTSILNRNEDSVEIVNFLTHFEKNKHMLDVKRGIYIYGDSGTGKTTFITNVLKQMNYDIVKYDAGDIRNKSIIETITKHNMSDKNVLSMFQRKTMKIAILMDEIDGMNNGDKGGINLLIKLIRPKKTKKQKNEEITLNPIICIGSCHLDKKMKELMKVCHVVELKKPTHTQMTQIVHHYFPHYDTTLTDTLIQFSQYDLRKLNSILELCSMKTELQMESMKSLFKNKTYNEDTKKIVKRLLNQPQSIDMHNALINDNDRTVVALLWHENVVDMLEKYPKSASIPFYLKVLDNICFADYLDRITFQKQIWKFNEMSSLIKTFQNNKLYHENFKKIYKYNPLEVRFTKVLTKYSTEYNNSLFIQNLCQMLAMDKKDMYVFFMDLKEKYNEAEIYGLLENYDIGKLDVCRMYRYLDKYVKHSANNNSNSVGSAGDEDDGDSGSDAE
jgi:hypothetical protein